RYLGKLLGLETLVLDDTRVTGQGLYRLSPLVNLARLHLRNTGVTDKDLKDLMAETSVLKNLSHLDIGGSRVGSPALETFREMSKLRTLYLNGEQIDGKGLAILGQRTSIETLVVHGGPDVMEWLRAAWDLSSSGLTSEARTPGQGA